MLQSDVSLYKHVRIILDEDEFVLTYTNARTLAVWAVTLQQQLSNSQQWRDMIAEITPVLDELAKREKEEQNDRLPSTSASNLADTGQHKAE